MTPGYSASLSSSDALSSALRNAVTTGSKTFNFGTGAGSGGITSQTILVGLAIAGLVAVVWLKKKKS